MPFKDKEVGRAWAAAYREKNREKERQKQRNWITNNRERRLEWERLHRQRPHVQAVRTLGHIARRGLLKDRHVEPVARSLVLSRDKGIYGICQTPVDENDWHMDHIIPLSKGGDHSYANVQVSHPLCNLRKGVRTTE